MTFLHPSFLLDELLSKTHRPERQGALRGIYAVCEAQAKGTARDFSVSTIGTLCESLGILKKKTLSNASSADLLALIEAWRTFAGREVEPKPDESRPTIEKMLLAIPDPALRMLIQGQLAERSRLISQVNLLKSTTTLTINRSAVGKPTPKEPDERPAVRLPDSEIAALREVLTSQFLFDEGWEEGSDGEVRDTGTGRRIFPKGFLSALRRVVDWQ
jgi:hypothetical protein